MTTEPTWANIEVPLMRSIYAAEQEGKTDSGIRTVAEGAGIDLDIASRSIRRLFDADYVTGIPMVVPGNGWSLHAVRLTERGLRAIAAWPAMDQPFESLLAFLDESISDESDPVRRSKLVRFRRMMAETGKDVVTAVLSSWARQLLGP